jgi:hypothetical protein
VQSLDLTAQAPRSPFVKLGGLLMFARTIDKLRAELPGGKMGDFHFSVMSEWICEQLRLAHDDLLEVVRTAETDDDVVAWLHANSDRSLYTMINNALLERKIDNSNRERLTKKYPVIAGYPNLTSVLEMLDLDDAHQFLANTHV